MTLNNAAIPSQISNWRNLEVFDIGNQNNVSYPPKSLSKLSNIKYLNIATNKGITDISWICNMESLRVLLAPFLQAALPECMLNLESPIANSLQVISIANANPSAFNWTLVQYPNLQILIAVNINISFNESGPEFHLNQTNLNAVYYLQRSQICLLYNQFLTFSLDNGTIRNKYLGGTVIEDFLDETNACRPYCGGEIAVLECTPFQHGNGICNEECNILECGYDAGDCSQNCAALHQDCKMNYTMYHPKQCKLCKRPNDQSALHDKWNEPECNSACLNPECNMDNNCNLRLSERESLCEIHQDLVAKATVKLPLGCVV